MGYASGRVAGYINAIMGGTIRAAIDTLNCARIGAKPESISSQLYVGTLQCGLN